MKRKPAAAPSTFPGADYAFRRWRPLLAALLSLALCRSLPPAVPALHAAPSTAAADEALAVVARMQTAYGQLTGYQTEIETKEYRDGRVTATRRFRYSLRKANRLRIDMKTPHPGMRLIYPDPEGRVAVRFGGWLKFLQLRLAPDNALFATPSGQRIDQSDFGQLIRNIGRSVGEEKRGETQMEEKGRHLLLTVDASDHFLPEVVTRYRLIIDRTLWLPVAVEERTPAGHLKRTIHFRQLNTRPEFPQHFFAIEEEVVHGSAAEQQ